MPELIDAIKLGQPYVRLQRDSISLHFESECIQSMMSCRNPDFLEVPYTKTMMGFLLANPNPGHILLIGLGGGSLAKFCYRYLPETRITAVEISREVIALRGLFKIPPDDDRFCVRCADGADFVRNATSDFDVILVDGFDPQGQSAQLTTQDFYENCCRALKPNGLFVANLDDGHSEHNVFLNRAMATFNNCVVEIEVPERSNCIIFARKDIPMSSHRMSLNWTLEAHTTDVQQHLNMEFQRILKILDALEPLNFSGSQRVTVPQ